MSGGSWDYFYSKLGDVADTLEHERSVKRRTLGKLFRYIEEAMHDIEWVDSGDYGADDDLKAIDKVLNWNGKKESLVLLKKEIEEKIKEAKNVLKEFKVLAKNV